MNTQVTYALITHPAAAMQKVRAMRSFGTAIALLIAGAVGLAVGGALQSAAITGGKDPVIIAIYVLGGIVAALGFWIFIGSLTHSAACLMGGYGRLSKFLAAYAMAWWPYVLTTPVVLLLAAAGPRAMSVGFGVVSLVLTVWWFVLTVIAVKELYGLSKGGAVIAAILPYLLIGVAIGAGIVSGVSTLLLDAA